MSFGICATSHILCKQPNRQHSYYCQIQIPLGMERIVSLSQINGGLIPNQKLIEPRQGKTCFMPYANNKSADQPAHPRSLLRCLDCILSLVSISEISRLKLSSVAAQTGLFLISSQTPKTHFLKTWLNSKHLTLTESHAAPII